MNSYKYLYLTTLKNKVKKALKRPVTYLAVIGLALYIGFLGFSLRMMVAEMHVDKPEYLAMILSLIVFFLIPGNILSYLKRKGLIFMPGEVHFMFPAPLDPKKNLIFAGFRGLKMKILYGVIMFFVGLIFFHVPVITMILYLVLSVILSGAMEFGMMILLYGSDHIPEKFVLFLRIVLYVLMAVFVLVAILMLVSKGASAKVISEYLQLPVIQLIPIIGWNISFIYLIVLGPTTVNVIASLLYIAATVLLVIAAYKSKCTGEYYEDAMKFSDDYIAAKQKKDRGEAVYKIGGHKKYKEATVEYKGGYAKAIFYRQLLEYKKTKLYIFNAYTFLCLGIGVAIAIAGNFVDVSDMSDLPVPFILPGLMAYLLFIFSGYATKWSKELKNPYTYLIPDTNFHKLWYATLVENIRSLIDAALITIPASLTLGLSFVQIIMTILVYVALNACKLYSGMLSEALLGNILGEVGKVLIKMLFVGIIIVIGVLLAVVGTVFISIDVGFALMVVAIFALTFVTALLASNMFEKMEVKD